MKHTRFPLLIGCLAITQMAGFFGSIFNLGSLTTWYNILEKSSLTPPGWVFGAVWTLLFLLMGISLYLAILSGHRIFSGNDEYFTTGMIWFVVQWLLNVGWSFIFFYLRQPLWAFYEVIALIVSIAVTMYYFYQLRRWSAYLLIPYLAWACFAAYLTLTIYRLNY
jgi:tryptophan-rich sensory protein